MHNYDYDAIGDLMLSPCVFYLLVQFILHQIPIILEESGIMTCIVGPICIRTERVNTIQSTS